MRDDHGVSGMLVAFGAGALLGAAAALLLAPKRGTETRREISDMASDTLDRGRTLADQARNRTREAAESAGEFVRDQKERVGHAIHEGKAAYLRETAGA